MMSTSLWKSFERLVLVNYFFAQQDYIINGNGMINVNESVVDINQAKLFMYMVGIPIISG